VSFLSITKTTNFGVHDSKGSAETIARKGRTANYHLKEYSFSNISAKNYQNRLMCIEVIVCNVSVVFLRHSVYATSYDGFSYPVVCHYCVLQCLTFVCCRNQ